MQLNHQFETSDSALAAYLISEGYPEPTLRNNNNRCVFCFDGDDGKMQSYIRAYQSGDATTNVSIFYHNYKRVLRMVHDIT